MLPNKNIIKCPSCGEMPELVSSDNIVCSCGHAWGKINNVWNLNSGIRLPLPKMYQNIHYLNYISGSVDNHNYFYNGPAPVRFVQNAGHRAIKKILKNYTGKVAVDLGCGIGPPWSYDEFGGEWYGVDTDLDGLSVVAKREDNIIPIYADATNLPFQDNCIDFLLSIYCLEHILHLDFVLEEIVRVLKRRGSAAFSIPCEGGLAWNIGRRLSSQRVFSKKGILYEEANLIDHCNTSSQILRAIKRHFTIEKKIWFPFKLYNHSLNLVLTIIVKNK